jgi:hypothetical protein
LKILAVANHLHYSLADLIHTIALVIHKQNQPDVPERLDFDHHYY